MNTKSCQAPKLITLRRKKHPFLIILAALISVGFLGSTVHAEDSEEKTAQATSDENVGDESASNSLLQPVKSVAATMPSISVERDKLISPPGEEPYYPVRNDGQAFIINIDTTVNLTRAINEFIWNPRIEGEVWTPFDTPELIERSSRLMSTWPEYDEANIYRSFTRVNKFFERISGFGP